MLLRACALAVLSLAALGACSDGDEPPMPASPFEATRLSVVFIDTDLGTGSGVIFDGDGHIVTNYHVIDDTSSVDVVLPDGATVEDVEILGFDRQADIAVLQLDDPVGLRPLPLGLLDDTPIGAPVFAVGFPLEGGIDDPIVQISSGIVSALRPGVLGRLQYVQTDASFNPGISGGALVNDRGEFIGMPTLSFTEDDTIGFAISVDDVVRVAGAIIGGFVDEVPFEAAVGRETSGAIRRVHDAAGFRVELEEGETFRASLTTDEDAALSLVSPFGDEVAYADEIDQAGLEEIEYEVEDSGPHTLAVIVFVEDTSYSLSASHDLAPFSDPEDDRSIRIGAAEVGELQFAGDEDTFFIDLSEGQSVRIILQTWDFDAVLYLFAPSDQFAREDDDDSGLGLLANDSLIEFTAEEDGIHEIGVSFFGNFNTGYFPGVGFYKLVVRLDP